ncbi:Uncharacterized protein OBRU01_24552, partial [Operophtera brumata]
MSQVWRQIGIMHEQLSASKGALDKLNSIEAAGLDEMKRRRTATGNRAHTTVSTNHTAHTEALSMAHYLARSAAASFDSSRGKPRLATLPPPKREA